MTHRPAGGRSLQKPVSGPGAPVSGAAPAIRTVDVPITTLSRVVDEPPSGSMPGPQHDFDWIPRPDTAEYDAFLIELEGESADAHLSSSGGGSGDDGADVGFVPVPPRGSRTSRLAFKIGLVMVAAAAIWASVIAIRPDGPSIDGTGDLNSDQDAAPLEINPLLDEAGRQLRVDGTVVPNPDQPLDGDVTMMATESTPAADAEPSTSASAGTSTTDETSSASAATGTASTQGRTNGTGAAATGSPAAGTSADYQSNLTMIRSASVRNTNHDNSAYRNTPMDQIVPEKLYGPRSEYLQSAGFNPEQSFPVPNGGQFRTACEFSHFSYDDPLVYPGRPGASHLHMHFGNTDVNAFSTYSTLLNSGSGTCNGQELNRTGYWVPAMFDGNGNVRVPERIVVYYKGEGLARGKSEVYPEGAAMIVDQDINQIDNGRGGAVGKFSFVCSDNFSGESSPASNAMPSCDGSRFKNQYGVDENPHTVLEMNVKFPQCWNGKDPSNPDNFRIPSSGGWYYSNCTGEFSHTLPNLEYFVNYKVDVGENTGNWFLSSDVDPTSFGTAKAQGGSTLHGDWWGGWHKQVNEMFINNCVNYQSSTASGCGFGYLTDGGPNSAAPYDGPALKMRPQYTGPHKVAASQIFAELCPQPARQFQRPEDAAYCAPGSGY
jgi:hypothetical protein